MKNYRPLLGKTSVLTAGSALRSIEMAISEAVTGWNAVSQMNLFGRNVDVSGKPGLAYAMGIVSGGLRAGLQLNDEILFGELDLLREASRRHLAMVVHVDCTKSRRGYHAAQTSGCIAFYASSVQEAVDLTLVAHVIAEQALAPVLIGMDSFWNVATSVEIPAGDTIKTWLGTPDDFIESPTPSQKMVFGKTRRRIPNWFHFDFPVAHGLRKTGRDVTFEMAANRVFVNEHVPSIVDSVAESFEKHTNRPMSGVRSHRIDDAEFVVLIQGSSFRYAAEAVDILRQHKINAGCIGLTFSNPMPARSLVPILGRSKAVTIVDFVSDQTESDGFLFRKTASLIDKAVENSRKKKRRPFVDIPALAEKQRPSLFNGFLSEGDGHPSTDEFVAIFKHSMDDGVRSFFVNIDLVKKASDFPKQQILLQSVKREYADLEERIIRPEANTGTDPRLKALRFSLYEDTDQGVEFIEFFTGVAARRMNTSALGSFINDETVQVTLRPVAEDMPVEKIRDIDAFVTNAASLNRWGSLDTMIDGGSLVFVQRVEEGNIQLQPRIAAEINRKRLNLFRLPVTGDTPMREVLMGVGLSLLSAVRPDQKNLQKEMDLVDKVCKEMFGESLTDMEKTALFLGLSGLERVEILRDVQTLDKPMPEIPMALRRYEDKGPAYTRVAQFYDRVGYFASAFGHGELFADPYQSLPVTPAATANFIRADNARTHLPVFKPESCTGCGACSVLCPHVALPMNVVSVETLLKSAVERLQNSGITMNQLIPPVVKNLAKLGTSYIAQQKDGLKGIGEVIDHAIGKLAPQMKLDDDRLGEIKQQLDAVTSSLRSYKGAVTAAFFSEAERQNKGSGSLFSITVNSQSCTGCGLCADVCSEKAIEMMVEQPEIAASALDSLRVWEMLPDTPGDVILKMVENESYNPVAAVMLSRNYYMSMAGGALGEHGSPEKAAVHTISSVAESVTQSMTVKQIDKIEKTVQQLTEKIRSKLVEAIPGDDFDSLLDTLHDNEESRLSLDTLITKMASTRRLGVVETAWIERLVSLTKELKTLNWVLKSGPSGVGRARYGTVIATKHSAAWARTYPFNPMIGPVVVCEHAEAADFALGLCRGHLRQMTDNIKLLRRADLESQNKYDPSIHDSVIATLDWNDLTHEERAMVPPVFLLTDVEMLSESNLSSLIRLLAAGYPVKVLLLDPGFGGVEYWHARASALLNMTVMRKFEYSMCSAFEPRHMFKCVTESLRSTGPALLQVLAPPAFDRTISPEEYLRLSLESRSMPLLRFKPSKERSFLSTAFDLNGNPNSYDDFVSKELEIKTADTVKKTPYQLTYADWAYRQPSLRSHFSLIEDDTQTPMSVVEYLRSDDASRTGKVVCITVVDRNGIASRFAVSEAILRSAEAAHRAWDTMREIAGMTSPHPEKLKGTLEEVFNKKHASAVDQIKAEYEERLRQQEQKQMEVVKQKLRDKLLSLSGYHAS